MVATGGAVAKGRGAPHDRAVAQRAVVAGIDEAGYGPVLGPLVVSAAVFEVPAERVDGCLWTALKASVAPSPRPRDRRVAILDSKKLYQRAEGLGPLERSALAAVTAWRGLPPTAAALLDLLCPAATAALAAQPWYGSLDLPLPRAADAGGVRLAAGRLRADGEAQGARLTGLLSEPLAEQRYNRMVAATRNKALVLFALTTRLIQRVADAFPGRTLYIFADKQGARGRYGRMLRTAFEDRRLIVHEETADRSVYELCAAPATWRIQFAQNGEAAHLPVALASIVSKYVRELLMAAFNDWWARQVPGVAATAGYYRDGLRFFEQVRPHLARLNLRQEQLLRAR